MIKNLDSLAGRLKGIEIDGKEITPQGLKDMITSESEVEITVSDINLFNNDELETLKKNHGDIEYGKGKTKGVEMAVKEAREKHGLEFEGKNIDNLMTAFGARLTKDLGKEPNEKIKEVTGKYDILKATYDKEKEGWGTEKIELNTKYSKLRISTKFESSMPKLENGMKKNHASMIFQSENDLEEKDNKLVVKRNGEYVRDNLGELIPASDVFTAFASESGWLKAAGRGDGNEGGNEGSFKTKDEAWAHIRKNNIEPGSDEAKKLLKGVE